MTEDRNGKELAWLGRAGRGGSIALCSSYARHDINVNAICPGVSVTALSRDNLATRARDEGVSLEEIERRRNITG
jgi:NAD(P)-dependent dehydrogenase (short-subunit alcohol dehydrogenase family)